MILKGEEVMDMYPDWKNDDGFWWGVKATIDDVLWGVFWGAVISGIIFSFLF